MAGVLSGSAAAVEAPPSDGSTPTGPIQSPTGVGMVTTSSGFQEVGSPYTGGQGQQYSPLASAYNSSPFSTPAPGTAILRVDLQTVMYGEGAWWTGMNGSGVGGYSAALNGAITERRGQQAGTLRDRRLCPPRPGHGRHEQERHPLRCLHRNPRKHAEPELGGRHHRRRIGFRHRQRICQLQRHLVGHLGLNTQQTLYVRQAWAYVGTDTVGIFRIGQGFSSNSLMQTGLNDEFDAGGWVGCRPAACHPRRPARPGRGRTCGNEYQAARIGYLSPVFAGFDSVVSFAPNNAPATSAGDTCSTVFTGCISQSTSNAAGDLGRYRNEFEIGLRYRNAWGPIGLAASGIYTVSAATNPGPTAPLGAAGTPAGANNALRYNGLNMGMVGAEVTINRYMAIGANTMFGDFNGSWGLQNKAPYCSVRHGLPRL